MISSLQMRPAQTALLATALLMTGCASINSGEGPLSFLQPYRVEVVQGNVVTQEMVDRVKPGMTRQQVRDVLGAPLLADPFHADRWDYVFTIRRQGTPFQQRRVTVLFGKDDRLASIEADPLPSEREFVASIDRTKRGGTPPVLELSPEQIRALPVPAKTAGTAVAAPAVPGSAALATTETGAKRSYPPLESGQ